MLGRREFCLTASATLLAAAPKKIPVALQLFSVRQQCEMDLPRTLARVSQMGYEGVELAGYYGRPPLEFRRLLAEHNLPIYGAHVPYESLQGSFLESTIQFQKDLGNKNLIVPGLPAAAMRSLEAWKETGQRFAQMAETLRGHGMRLGYHNHAVEFKPVDGETPWAIFLNSSGSNVMIELDLGNAGFAGVDPVETLKNLQARAKFVHVKDFTPTKPDLVVGQGQLDWPAFYAASSGVDYFVIEHDADPKLDMSDIADCITQFRARAKA